jgi:hypothetical protein
VISLLTVLISVGDLPFGIAKQARRTKAGNSGCLGGHLCGMVWPSMALARTVLAALRRRHWSGSCGTGLVIGVEAKSQLDE